MKRSMPSHGPAAKLGSTEGEPENIRDSALRYRDELHAQAAEAAEREHGLSAETCGESHAGASVG